MSLSEIAAIPVTSTKGAEVPKKARIRTDRQRST